MPPRPFPLALGVGTDIVHASRIRNVVLKLAVNVGIETAFDRFTRRFLTYREQRLFWARYGDRKRTLSHDLDNVVKHIAGRWAAKEAAIKASRNRALTFMDIEILRSETLGGRQGIYALILDTPGSPHSPSPVMERPDESRNEDIEDPSGQIAKISISHDGEYATAVCIIAEGPLEGDVGGEIEARDP